jgi:hypothetical protein
MLVPETMFTEKALMTSEIPAALRSYLRNTYAIVITHENQKSLHCH